MSGKYALIIGNTEYTDPSLAQLTAPGKDAEDFARVLTDQEICAFDEVNVLLNESEAMIREAIDGLFYQKKPDDLIVLYFSGHGVRDEYGVLYLAVKNTNRSRLRSTAVKSDYIRESMDQSRSKRQVLILDCCNSGAFAHGTKAATGGSIGTASAFEGTGYGRIVLTASDATQFAWEGGKVIGDTDNSLFTHFLVEGLKGEADVDGDGRITVDELYDYAYEKVRFATPKQTPSKFSSKQQGEIVLRQNIRIEDTRPVPLPDELINAINSSLPYIREGAVRQLELLLKGRNLRLARSARQALEKIAEEDDSRKIAQFARDILNTHTEDQPKSHDQQAESLTRTGQLRRQQVEQASRVQVEQEKFQKEKAELQERLKAEQAARKKIETNRKSRKKIDEKITQPEEEAQSLTTTRAEEQAAERARRQKAKEELPARDAVRKITEAPAQKASAKPVSQTRPFFKMSTIGVVVLFLLAAGVFGIWVLSKSPATPTPVKTAAPVTSVEKATEAPVTEAQTIELTISPSETSSSTQDSPTKKKYSHHIGYKNKDK